MALGDTTRSIIIKFTGNTTQLVSSTQKASSGLKKFGQIATASLAATAIVRFGKQSIAAFKESEEAQLRLSDAFEKFPALANTNIEKLRALNVELARKTRFDDDATASGQASLAMFKFTGQQVEILTPLMQDFAAKTGMSLPGAARIFGKAMLGQGRGLKAVGINFKDLGSETKNYEQLVTKLREKVGGFAEKEGKTLSGQQIILNNQFDELKETVGGKLVPVMLKLADVGLRVVDWISKNWKIMGPLLGVIAAVTVAQWAWNLAMAANPIGLIIIGIAALVAGIIWVATKTKFFQTVWRVAWGGAKAAAFAVGRWFVETLWGRWLKPAFTGIGAVAMWLWHRVLEPFWEGWQRGTTRIMGFIRSLVAVWLYGMNLIVSPILKVVGPAILWLWNSVIKPAWGGIRLELTLLGMAFGWLWSKAIKPALSFIGGALFWLWSTVSSIFGKIWGVLSKTSAIFRSIFGAIAGYVVNLFGRVVSDIKAVINALIDLINKAVGGINNNIINNLNKIPGVSFGHIPTLPRLARGGTARAGRDYLVGESGPEILRMGGRSGQVIPNSRLGDTWITVYIGDQELRGIVRAEVREGTRSMKRGVLAGAGAR